MTRPEHTRAVTAAAVVVAVEGTAAAVAGLVFVVAALVRRPTDQGTAVLLGVLFVVFGVGLLAIARGLRRGGRWAQTPSYLAQFFGLIVAWYQRSTLPVVSVALAVVCVTAVVALTRAMREQRD